MSEKIPSVRCVSHVYGHHATRSGYHQLARYVGGEWVPSTVFRALGDTAIRIPAKLYAQRCRLYEYSRHSVVAELEILVRTLCGGNAIWHHLYGEKTFLLSSALRGLRTDCQIATFHHHPTKFSRMVSSTGHLRRLDHAIAMSSEQVEYLESVVGVGKVSVVLHGIDTEYWCPAESPTDGKHRLVFAGNHLRDFKTLGQVVERVLNLRNDVEFVLISSDLQCARFAQTRGVRWLYKVSDEVYRKELQRATLLVLPLLYSTAVNAVLESLACGIPVVTTKGGISDYLNEECAVTLPPREIDGFVDTIVALLDDPTLEEKRKAARMQAETLSWEKSSEAVRSLYKNVTG